MFDFHSGNGMYIVERSMTTLSGYWFFIWGNSMAIRLIYFICKKILEVNHSLYRTHFRSCLIVSAVSTAGRCINKPAAVGEGTLSNYRKG